MKNRGRIGAIAGLVIVLASFGYLIYGNIGDNLVYFLTPGEVLAQGPKALERPLKLGGQVVPGSVKWDAAAIVLEFKLQDPDGAVLVRARKEPPAMFREGQGVIVEGRMTKEGIFECTSLMVKHSNEYRPPDAGHPQPREMYKSLIKES
jgi:cytochrome c-type biogenesis protein CcmE